MNQHLSQKDKTEWQTQAEKMRVPSDTIYGDYDTQKNTRWLYLDTKKSIFLNY